MVVVVVTDGMVWSNGCGLNAQPPTARKPNDTDRDVPSCVVTYPYPPLLSSDPSAAVLLRTLLPSRKYAYIRPYCTCRKYGSKYVKERAVVVIRKTVKFRQHRVRQLTPSPQKIILLDHQAKTR